MKILVRKSIFIFLTSGAIFSFTTATWSAPIDITGSYVDPDAHVVYTVGTEHDDNPAIGLDFYAEGALSYDYSLQYDLSGASTRSFIPGDSKSINDLVPKLSLTGTPSLTTHQSVTSGTNLFFGIDTWLTGDFYEEVGLPNFDPPGDGLSVTLNNSGTLLSTGTNFEDKSASWGTGTGIVSGGSDTMYGNSGGDVWSMNYDLFSIHDALWPIDVLLDLELGLGMNIVQESNLMALIDYDFVFDPITLNVSDSTTAGTYFTDITGTLTYDLVFQSDYDYSGNASLTFDAPLIDEIDLWSHDLGQFDVGTLTNFYTGSVEDITLSMQYEVLDPELCTYTVAHGWVCRDPVAQQLYPPSIESFITSNHTTYTTDRVDYAPEPVPEPATILLLGSGLAGLAFYRRKRK